MGAPSQGTSSSKSVDGATGVAVSKTISIRFLYIRNDRTTRPQREDGDTADTNCLPAYSANRSEITILTVVERTEGFYCRYRNALLLFFAGVTGSVEDVGILATLRRPVFGLD